MSKARRIWLGSFFTRAIAFRYLLTPFGTIVRYYHVENVQMAHLDVYVFGVRIARIHRV